MAIKYGLTSVAFPLISSGIYGYPKEKALQVAMSVISEYLMTYELSIFLVVYDKKAFVLSEKLFSSVQEYIDDNYIDEKAIYNQSRDKKYACSQRRKSIRQKKLTAYIPQNPYGVLMM